MFKRYFQKRNTFRCPECNRLFQEDRFWHWLICPHLFDTWRLIRCPFCDKLHWMHYVTEDEDYYE